jgi:lipoprotein-releasing system ATP-binding protein
MNPTLLRADLIDYSFNDLGSHGSQSTRVLREVSLCLNAGEITAVVGPSGCGKSTLLYLLGLLDRPDGGSIFIKGEEVGHSSDEVRTRLRNEEIGFVFQFHFLIQELTVLENVALPLQKSGLAKAEARQSACALLEQLGMSSMKERHAHKLSGGERQRVAIARALANQPSILLADEPTGNLDSHNSDTVFNLMLQLAKEKNVGVLIVTHNLDLAARCDRVISIRDGVIVNSGDA